MTRVTRAARGLLPDPWWSFDVFKKDNGNYECRLASGYKNKWHDITVMSVTKEIKKPKVCKTCLVQPLCQDQATCNKFKSEVLRTFMKGEGFVIKISKIVQKEIMQSTRK